MIAGRRIAQPELAEDLGPQVQGGLGRLPIGVRKRGQRRDDHRSVRRREAARGFEVATAAQAAARFSCVSGALRWSATETTARPSAASAISAPIAGTPS